MAYLRRGTTASTATAPNKSQLFNRPNSSGTQRGGRPHTTSALNVTRRPELLYSTEVFAAAVGGSLAQPMTTWSRRISE